MILRIQGETTLDAVERLGRTFSVEQIALVRDGEDNASANIAFLYELIGVLAAEVRELKASQSEGKGDG